jgi:hypothetical protein
MLYFFGEINMLDEFKYSGDQANLFLGVHLYRKMSGDQNYAFLG